MAILLDERKGISSGLLYVLAAIAGITVANLYYNQPLLDMIRVDLEASEMEANHIALFTQLGYALGLLFISLGYIAIMRKRGKLDAAAV